MSQEKKYKYESVFAHASFQFCGHIDEYLIENTKYLTLIRFQTRFGNGGHKLERYENGVLKETRSLRSSHNIFLYYFLCSWHHNIELRRHIQRVKKTTIAMFTHPIGCFGFRLQKILGKVKYAFWPWDWFPPVRVPLKIYAAVVKHYIKRVDFPFALTEGISKEIGENVPVVMLGMKRLQCAETDRTRSKRILVVGQLRRGQGIENVLEFIAANPQYSLTLLGAAANGFESEIYSIINRTGTAGRVDFPNRFVSQEELSEAASKCFCGLALYDTASVNLYATCYSGTITDNKSSQTIKVQNYYAADGRTYNNVVISKTVIDYNSGEILSYGAFAENSYIESVTFGNNVKAEDNDAASMFFLNANLTEVLTYLMVLLIWITHSMVVSH